MQCQGILKQDMAPSDPIPAQINLSTSIKQKDAHLGTSHGCLFVYPYIPGFCVAILPALEATNRSFIQSHNITEIPQNPYHGYHGAKYGAYRSHKTSDFSDRGRWLNMAQQKTARNILKCPHFWRFPWPSNYGAEGQQHQENQRINHEPILVLGEIVSTPACKTCKTHGCNGNSMSLDPPRADKSGVLPKPMVFRSFLGGNYLGLGTSCTFATMALNLDKKGIPQQNCEE